ncbi:hypothetical protein ACSSV1_004500 [Labrenzia sp. MBR-25]
MPTLFVIPVCRVSGKTGIQYAVGSDEENPSGRSEYWIPAFAGMTRGMGFGKRRLNEVVAVIPVVHSQG